MDSNNTLWMMAGLAMLVIDDKLVFPAYEDRQLCISLEDDGLILTNWLTGAPVLWKDLSPVESERMIQHMALRHHLNLIPTQN